MVMLVKAFPTRTGESFLSQLMQISFEAFNLNRKGCLHSKRVLPSSRDGDSLCFKISD